MSIQSVSFGNLPNQPKATKKTHKGALIGATIGMGWSGLNLATASKSTTGKQIMKNALLKARNALIATGLDKKVATTLAKHYQKIGFGVGAVLVTAIGATIGALVDRAKNQKA
jgi:hypothetical protein